MMSCLGEEGFANLDDAGREPLSSSGSYHANHISSVSKLLMRGFIHGTTNNLKIMVEFRGAIPSTLI